MRRAGVAGFAEHFRSTTRGQIVDQLRCRAMTVDELAAALDMTAKGIRAHLVPLERDGFVRHHSRRRSGKAGKPAVVYEFDPAAEYMFCSGYAPTLIAAIEVLKERMDKAAQPAAFQKMGEALARGVSVPHDGDPEEQIRAALALLNAWGGVPRVERSNGSLRIVSCGCPVSLAVRTHPETCAVFEAMLASILGTEVRERCNRANSPACCFEVRAAWSSGRKELRSSRTRRA